MKIGSVGAGSALDASCVVGNDGAIYSGRAGVVYQLNPFTLAMKGVSSGVNNSVTSIDPARSTIYVGWKDTPLATLTPGAYFGPGNPHSITGSDGVVTGIAFDSKATAWYTTGGEDVLGNVGTIDLRAYSTTRRLTAISATTIIFDSFTGHLFTAGIDGIAQIDPSTGTVVSTWKNPQGQGLFIQNLASTGKGHLLAMDSSNLVRIWDMSSSRLIGSAATIQASTPTDVANGGLVLSPIAPSIISPRAETATAGVPFYYQIIALGNPTSYAAARLPPGLSFDSTLAAIFGTPTQTGQSAIILSATNPQGTATVTLNLNVRAAPSTGLSLQSSTAATLRRGTPFRLQAFTTGGSANTRLTATGLPPGVTADPVTGVISGTPTTDGSYNVTLAVIDGDFSSTQTLELTVISDPAFPAIISPTTATVTKGESFSYHINAPTSTAGTDPVTYALLGALPAGLTFDSKTGTISGIISPIRDNAPPVKRALSGGIIGNVQLFARNSTGTGTIPLVFFLPPQGAVNISTRLPVGTSDDVLIGGFIITGNAPKQIVVRGIGPSLTVGGALPDTVLELHDASSLLGTNDNWRDSQENELINTGIPPSNTLESALLAGVSPGGYTAVLRGKNDSTGIGVVEIYDLGTASLDISSNAQLAQISTRGRVLTGDDVMIGGFIISGDPTKVIARAIGPELNGTVTDPLQNPTLELHDASGATLAWNDNWRDSQEQEIKDTGVPPADDRESAIVATLNAGAYTAIVRGKNDTTGAAIVEVYKLN
jgi:hypothetical protein